MDDFRDLLDALQFAPLRLLGYVRTLRDAINGLKLENPVGIRKKLLVALR